MVRRQVMGVIVALTLGIIVGCDGIPNTLFVATGDVDLSLPFGGVRTLSIAWGDGAISVTVDQTATNITVTGTKRAIAADVDSVDAALDDVDIALALSATDTTRALLTYDAPSSRTAGYGYSATISVTLPAGVTLEIESDSGDVTVTGNTGDTTIDLATGDVTVTDQVGHTAIELATGQATVEASGGDVDVIVARGSASIDVQPAPGSSIVGRVDVGDLSIAVPSDFAASLDLTAGAGLVNARLTDFTLTGLESAARAVSVTLNGGGGAIVGQTGVGNVTFDSLN